MKKLSTLLCIISCLAFIGCEDNIKNTEQPDDKNDQTEDVFKMTVSSTSIILEEAKKAEEAISITWTKASDHGTGSAINYSLELSANEKSVVALNPIPDIYSIEMSGEELNQFIVDNFNVRYGATTAITLELTASVADHPEYDQVETATVEVTTYQPAPVREPLTSTLYIMGDATQTNYDLGSAQELTMVSEGEFTAKVRLTAAGQFKFTTTRTDWVPSYNRGADNNTLVYRTSYDEPDEQFTVAEDGVYEVCVDLNNLTLRTEKTAEEPARFDNVYFVGSCTSWLFEPMDKAPLAKNVWYYGRFIQADAAGDFKFGTVNDGSWTNMFCATEENAPYTSTGAIFNHTQDWKWMLTDDQKGKAYKIYFDVTSGKEKMIMTEFAGFDGVWMVGPATPNGWDLGNATALTEGENYVYTWSGELMAGGIKFTCDKQADWYGKWFMSAKNESVPTGEEEVMVFIDKTGTFFCELYPDTNIITYDTQWTIPEQGQYTITLNALTHKIRIANTPLLP